MKIFILIFYYFIILSIAFAKSPIDLAIGLLRTHADKLSANIVARYAEGYMQSIEKMGDKNYIFTLSPEINIEGGLKDSFNGMTFKARGLLLKFSTKELLSGGEIPDLNKLFHAFPFSVGMETDQRFQNISTIAEAGYVPLWFPKFKAFKLGKNFQFGIFVQGGYKFQTSKETNQTGGAEDQSNEESNKPIGRLRAIIFVNQEIGGRIYLKGNAQGWYDFLNNKFYHQLDIGIRLTYIPGKHFDFKYQNGSGAPNFNIGNQFGASLAFDL